MFTLAFSDVEQFLRSDNFIAALAITLGCLVAMIGIIGSAVSGVVKSRAREQTRREIAAYVAEGTMDPDKAVEILNAGPNQAIAQRLAALGGKESRCKC